MYHVLIVDDHEMVRLGIKEHLVTDDRISVVEEAASAAESLEKMSENCFHVVLMDVRLQDKSGVEACKDILAVNPETQVIMLTAFDDDDALMESILAGASGYLMKEIRINTLIDSVIKAAKGETILDQKMTEKVVKYMRAQQEEEDSDAKALLTTRERVILARVAEGKTNKEIGEALHISEKTVRNQLSKIMHKLDLNNRAEAAAFYVSHLKS